MRVTIDKIIDLLAVKAHEKGLEFVSMIHHEVPSLLRGDPGRLRQILMNLVGNSIKFTDTGEVAIRAMLEDEDETHATIRFSVTDTGIGIPEDQLDRLFRSFSQADTSTTRRYGGTGLGLAISKQLSELMGGRIGVNSEDGKGAEFWFSVPFEKQPLNNEAPTIVPESLKEKRILIVDYNANSRQALKEQLKSWGCRFDEAPGGMVALEKLREAITAGDRFEIVILSMQMPDMTGEMLGREIVNDQGLQGTILILMTSIGNRGDVERLKKIGFAAYLMKPIKQLQFYNCLVTVTSTKRVSRKEKKEPIITRHSLEEQQKQQFRILLVEDNLVNQKVALRTLTKLGYVANLADNGRKALDMLNENLYHLVLMDCQMPVMDGYEATAMIRNQQSEVLNHAIPVIAMTAHAMQGEREKCIEAGMNDYLTKPIKPEELSKMLEKWMQHTKCI
ncbi:MAG: hypothetical protein C0403_06615 [Desulfobacterium sp.]|nr:hypothetical protein [Desulfobacterium sp.]